MVLQFLPPPLERVSFKIAIIAICFSIVWLVVEKGVGTLFMSNNAKAVLYWVEMKHQGLTNHEIEKGSITSRSSDDLNLEYYTLFSPERNNGRNKTGK